jgi:DNA invertase Pin-like site-specific DNA recombinase
MRKKPGLLAPFGTDKCSKTFYTSVVPTEQEGKLSKVCFSYIRFSSKGQAKGDSERRQLEIAPRVAAEKGWILSEDLNARDLGVSARNGSNLETIEGIIKAAEEAKIPNGSVMIIEALDRLTRITLDDAYQLFRRVLKAGLEIYTDRTGRHMTAADLNNSMSLMMTVVELDAAFQYSDKLSDRVGKAWRRKKAHAADGVKLTSMAPAWLDVDRKTNIIRPNEKTQIIRRIFKSYIKGKGVRAIVRELNAEKIPTFGKGKQNRGNGWASTHLRRLLSFRGVIGDYQPCKYEGKIRKPDGAPIEDYYPAVIDKATFYTAQQILAKNGHAGGCKRNATNLFTKIVQCAKCGAPMHIKRSPSQRGKYNYITLICSNALRGNECPYHTLRYEYLERAVLSVLWMKVLPVMSEADTRQDELSKMMADLKDIEAQIENWGSVIDQRGVRPEIAACKLNALDTRKAAIKRQIESLSAIISTNPLSAWKQVPPTIDNRLRLAAILQDEIEALTVDAQNLSATLKLKKPKWTFELSWENPQGANQVRRNKAAEGFQMLGKKLRYVDNLLVWKTSENVELNGVQSALLRVPEGKHINVVNPQLFRGWPGVHAVEPGRYQEELQPAYNENASQAQLRSKAGHSNGS